VARQGSLKLDEVQVIRNDLSDTDFEVVSQRAGERARKERKMGGGATVECDFKARPVNNEQPKAGAGSQGL
jgi:hypothetical protein